MCQGLGKRVEQGKPWGIQLRTGKPVHQQDFIGLLECHGVNISMDRRGLYTDNIFVERLWKKVKYEEVYLMAYSSGREAKAGLDEHFRFYDTRRPQQALGYRTPQPGYIAGLRCNQPNRRKRGTGS